MRDHLKGGIFRSLGLGRRWPRLWLAFAALAFIGQMALFAHQADHHRNLTLLGADDCAMCQFGSSMSAGPKPDLTITPPVKVVSYVVALPSDTAAPYAIRTASFRSRAPPVSVLALI